MTAIVQFTFGIVLALFIVLSGWGLYWFKRERDRRTASRQAKCKSAFLDLEQRRMKAYPKEVSQEIAEIIKERYPDANRHVRRTVKARYSSMVKYS
jgi:hypothetical protein